METALKREAVRTGLDYHETARAVEAFCAWKPLPHTRLLIKTLCRVVRPLEQGSYEGRMLAGEPHRSSWVIAGPLTVFVVPRASYRRRVYLAARLRHAGGINMVEVPRSESGSRSPSGRGKKDSRDAGLKRTEKRGSDALEALVAIQSESDVSLTLVPVAVTSHQLTPDAPAGSMADRVGRATPLHALRSATSLVRTTRTGRLKNAKPLVLAHWLDGRDPGGITSLGRELRGNLFGAMESEKRACAGPALVSGRNVKRRVLADPLLASYMKEYALREGVTDEAVFKEAREHVDEIASDYRIGVVRYFVRAVDYMFDRFLTGLEVDRAGIQFISECDSRNRVVLVCDHKSYIDPLLIGYSLFRSGMVPPQQAAGLNLNFWPVGWLLRHSGAFYLRRSFAGETLYREVFCAYVRYLLAENYVTVVYIEGTRSRDGKLARPRTGFLDILSESLRMGICQDVTLLPVYLGYDKVPEEAAHVREMAGGRKVGESVKGFAGLYRAVNTRLGKAYVKFGRPASLKELLRDTDIQGAAEEACRGINEITPVTARSLAAMALLSGGGDWIATEDLTGAAGVLVRFAAGRGLPVTPEADLPGVMAAVDWFATEGRVAPDVRFGRQGFHTGDDGRRFLQYNVNICLHHFLCGALPAAAARYGEGVEFLARVLDQEFVPGFAGDPADLERLDGHARVVLASLIEPYLEGYRVAARTALSMGDDIGVSRDEMSERFISQGERMLSDGSINRVESVSRVLFRNALKRFRTLGFVSEERTFEDGRELATISRGPRFDELAALEERLAGLNA
ncbi:MAG: 1-acyl-sn-glycerol-3-phosphate acyltransferase [Actinomycetota bacterium]